MFGALAISAFLVTACILVHYEALRLMSIYIPNLPVTVRLKVLIVVLGCFVTHTIEVWLYAGAFLLIYEADLGSKGTGRRGFRGFSLLLCDIVFHDGNRGRLPDRRSPLDLRHRRDQRSFSNRMVYVVHLLCDEPALAASSR